MTDRYILSPDGQTPIPEPDLKKWGKWYEEERMKYRQRTTVGRLRVSTVFLGINHALSETDPPVLWETMIFCDDFAEVYQNRYTSAEAARVGHIHAVNLAKMALEATPTSG